MATAADLTRLALALPGTTEALHFDRVAFRGARIYATLAPDGETANLMLTRDEQESACQESPRAFSPVPGGWGKNGATTVLLSALSVDELGEALETAWQRAQPKAGAKAPRRG